ncbi:MAG: tetratricopeptide repeat protein [Methylotenera sp.]
MALNIQKPLSFRISHFFTVKRLTWLFAVIAVAATASSLYFFNRIQQIEAFNEAISAGKPPKTDLQSFEAKFSTAYWLAQNERYKEATLLFNKALNGATTEQKAAIQYNLGNIFFRRGLIINGTSMTVRDEAEYLFRQAKTAYQQSLRLNHSNWGARHNLDRLLTMLPGTPTPGVGESDTPGLIMGNIPVGLP